MCVECGCYESRRHERTLGPHQGSRHLISPSTSVRVARRQQLSTEQVPGQGVARRRGRQGRQRRIPPKIKEQWSHGPEGSGAVGRPL
jgi:hypothetical protein